MDSYKVVCINVDDPKPCYSLTLDKVYDATKFGDNWITILEDDLGLTETYVSSRFIRLDDMRDEKLKDIGI